MPSLWRNRLSDEQVDALDTVRMKAPSASSLPIARQPQYGPYGHRQWIEIYWLPPYCPDLNLIERLWGHLKRTVIANVLFSSINDLVNAFQRGVRAVNAKRTKMGFMFDHDDITGKMAA